MSKNISWSGVFVTTIRIIIDRWTLCNKIVNNRIMVFTVNVLSTLFNFFSLLSFLLKTHFLLSFSSMLLVKTTKNIQGKKNEPWQFFDLGKRRKWRNFHLFQKISFYTEQILVGEIDFHMAERLNLNSIIYSFHRSISRRIIRLISI